MISYYVPGDASLAKQWLHQNDWSRTSDGLTRSRYPSRQPQTIPFWSLHWVMGVRDYWQHTGDARTVRYLLPGVLAVMDYFERQVTDQGIVGKLVGWQCADWCPQWTKEIDGNGVPPGTLAGHSSFRQPDDGRHAGSGGRNRRGRRARRHGAAPAVRPPQVGRPPDLLRSPSAASTATRRMSPWPAPIRTRGPYWRECPATPPSSPSECSPIPRLCQLTMFSGYFAYRALVKAGRYDLAPQLLAPWRKMLEWGLSTCPEIPDYSKTRSDCHAWSAGPLVEFCRGDPRRPARLRRATRPSRISPQPAGLQFARGRVPLTRLHGGIEPKFVSVDWRIENGRFILSAEAPKGVPCRVTLPGGKTQAFPEGGKLALRELRGDSRE